MALSNVSTGDKITARWANSLINEVNKLQPLEIKTTRMDYTGVDFTCMADYSEAFHMEWSNGNITLNAGQIYLNGQLIRPEKANNSYNQFSSVENYSEYEVIDIQDTIPELAIEIKVPKNYSDEKIKEVKARIVEIKKDSTGEQGEAGNEEPSEEEAKFDKITIQINELTADKKDFVQLVSGSVYLYTNANLPKDKEGIIICDEENEVENKETGEKTKVTTKVIKLNVSIIGEDGIEVLDSLYNSSYTKPEEEENPDGEEEDEEENPVRKFFIRGKKFSFIGDDGIIVEEKKEMISEDEGGTLETPKEQSTITIKNKPLEITTDFPQETKIIDDNQTEKRTIKVNPKIYNVSSSSGSAVNVIKNTGNNNNHFNEQILINTPWVSLISGDGIEVEKTVEYLDDGNGEKIQFYKVSISPSFIPQDNLVFDEEFFIVEDGTVKLKSDVIDGLINEAVEELKINVNVSGVLETTEAQGNATFDTQGYNLPLTTTVSNVY